MRRTLGRLAVVCSLLFCGGLLVAFKEGPVASRTGAFRLAGKSAEPTCILCHTNTDGIGINDPSGQLVILDVPKPFVPGATYPLRLRLQHDWNPLPDTPLRWGFQIQAVNASTGDSAGIWTTPGIPPNQLQLKRGTQPAWINRSYLEHTIDDIQEGAASPVEWTFAWTAPLDTAKVYFFAAGNAANGDDIATLSGDFIFTAVDSSYGGLAQVDVPRFPLSGPQYRTEMSAPCPNPMVKCTSFDFTIARAGFVDVAVYDVQGRRVQTIVHENREAGSYGSLWNGRRDDMSWVPNGVYFIRLKAPGETRAVTRKITLAR